MTAPARGKSNRLYEIEDDTKIMGMSDTYDRNNVYEEINDKYVTYEHLSEATDGSANKDYVTASDDYAVTFTDNELYH